MRFNSDATTITALDHLIQGPKGSVPLKQKAIDA